MPFYLPSSRLANELEIELPKEHKYLSYSTSPRLIPRSPFLHPPTDWVCQDVRNKFGVQVARTSKLDVIAAAEREISANTLGLYGVY